MPPCWIRLSILWAELTPQCLTSVFEMSNSDASEHDFTQLMCGEGHPRRSVPEPALIWPQEPRWGLIVVWFEAQTDGSFLYLKMQLCNALQCSTTSTGWIFIKAMQRHWKQCICHRRQAETWTLLIAFSEQWHNANRPPAREFSRCLYTP